MKEALFIRRRYTKGVPSLSEMVYKRIRGWTSGWKAAGGGGVGGWGFGWWRCTHSGAYQIWWAPDTLKFQRIKIAACFFLYNVWMFSSTFSNYIWICLELLRSLVIILFWFYEKILQKLPLVFTLCFCQQSMKLGVPVLARNIPGNSAVIQHGESGLLFDTPQVRHVTQTNCLCCDRY